ncbi:MAG TPA: S41 family peptidase [Chitinophagaceae bacterium]|jgi:C-terminal processing protease CtpA/Prc|nr:S41 family peptidase [Chitinophagaceae bacterium]
MELISLNRHSVEKIKQIILPHLISDGYNQTNKTASFERNFSNYYRLFVDTASLFVIKVKDSLGRLFTITIKGVLNSEREANRNQNPVNTKVISLTNPLEGSNDNLSLRFINDSIAYLRIRYFIGDRFPAEIDSLFDIISKQNTQALILDLRWNGGGLDEWGAYLASKFTTKPFRYIDRIHARILVPSFAEWKQKPPVDLINGTEQDPKGGYLIKPLLNRTLSEQHPAESPFTGKLVILINGKTFSAASDFTAIISNLTNAIFVGEETGGGYEGNTSALNAILKLPNSKIKVNIHLWDYWSFVKSPKMKGRGTMPDYYIERKPADWLNGIDTQREFALKLCLKKL